MCRLVDTWPDEQDGLWAEYAHLYRDGIAQGRGTAVAFDFYRRNRAAMDAGAVVCWKERIRDGEISALHTAENLLLETGDQFWAEYQNEPKKHGVGSVFLLTPEIVQSRATDRSPGVVPDWAQIVVAATDINPSYALSTAVVAFGANQVGAVLWYGLHKMSVPKETTEIEKRRIIYEHLAAHGRELAGLPCRPGSWFIDGGGSPEGCVIQFAYNAPQVCGLSAACCFGRGWKTYRPTAKATYRVRVGEQHHHVSERRDRQWIIYNADYWREVAQRGWTGEPGAPGSCSLPRGSHADFAAQVTREQLAGKDDVGGRTVWVWNTAPGPHDYGDCMHMAYMGAAVAGIGTGGFQPARREVRRRPKINMVQL